MHTKGKVGTLLKPYMLEPCDHWRKLGVSVKMQVDNCSGQWKFLQLKVFFYNNIFISHIGNEFL